MYFSRQIEIVAVAVILCFCAHTVMRLSPLAFEKVGRDPWMTRPLSASWLHLLPSGIPKTIWVSPHAHLCFLGLCHRDSGKGWSTEAEVKSRGRDTSTWPEFCLSVPVRWAELLASGENSLFSHRIAVSLKQTWGKDYEVWCNCYRRQIKKSKVAEETLRLSAWMRLQKILLQLRDILQRTLTPRCCYSHTHFHSAQ